MTMWTKVLIRPKKVLWPPAGIRIDLIIWTNKSKPVNPRYMYCWQWFSYMNWFPLLAHHHFQNHLCVNTINRKNKTNTIHTSTQWPKFWWLSFTLPGVNLTPNHTLMGMQPWWITWRVDTCSNFLWRTKKNCRKNVQVRIP